MKKKCFYLDIYGSKGDTEHKTVFSRHYRECHNGEGISELGHQWW